MFLGSERAVLIVRKYILVKTDSEEQLFPLDLQELPKFSLCLSLDIGLGGIVRECFILFHFLFHLVNKEKLLFSTLMRFGLSMEEVNVSRSCV